MLTDFVHKLRGLEWRIWGRRLGWGRRYEADSWSQSYAEGKWDFMRSPEESERYRALVSYCRRVARPAVLDVGCGEGILLEHFQNAGITPTEYLGLDIAAAAIDKARGLHPGFRFEVADAETFQPGSRFDVIVLNECLYYFRRPLKVLRNLEGGLAAGGVFVVSAYHPNHDAQRFRRYWENLISTYEFLDHQVVSSRKDITWNIGVFRPRGPAPAESAGTPAE